MSPRLDPELGWTAHAASSRAAPAKAAVADHPAAYRWGAIAVIIATLALLFGPGLLQHMRLSADPWHLNDDSRQFVWAFLRLKTPDLFPHDYIAEYYLATSPRAYRLLFEMSAPWIDPRTFGKVLPYVEFLIVLYAAMATTWRLAGPAAAWGTGALLLSTDVVLARLAGGLPRSFAFPLIALAALALVRGKAWRLAGLAVIAAGLYYPMAVLLGLTTAAFLLVAPAAWRGDVSHWSLGRRFGLVCLVAAAAGVIALPAAVGSRPYGPRLSRADVAAFPEAGLGGRYDAIDLPLAGKMTDTAQAYAVAPLFSRGPAWSVPVRKWGRAAAKNSLFVAFACAVVAVGYGLLIAADVGASRLLVLLASALVGYVLALALWPLLIIPARYFAYALPLLTCIAVPASVAALLRRLPGLRTRPGAAGALTVATVAALVFVLGGRGAGNAGMQIDVPVGERPLYAFLAKLPPDARIAGWPDDVMDNVPYFSERSILIGFETHQAYHRAYAEEMRRRMTALIAAYFASDVDPLLHLRDELGVTHLVVNLNQVAGSSPTYFKPFDAMIADAVPSGPRYSAALRAAESAAVFADGSFIVLDLRRLGPGPDVAPASDAPRP
jgi:hypothetical protein